MDKGITDKPFVVTYYPPAIYMCRKINKKCDLLNMNEETRKIFLQRPMGSFYSHKIIDYLVRPNVCSLDSDRVN